VRGNKVKGINFRWLLCDTSGKEKKVQNSLPPNIHENQKYCNLFCDLNAGAFPVMLLGAKQIALRSLSATILHPVLDKLRFSKK